MNAAVEDELVARVKNHFGNKLRTVDILPGDWTDEMLERLIISAPAVYIACPGGPRIPNEDSLVGINSRWIFYAITAHASGEKARRLGDLVQIGAYDIVKRLIPLVHNYTIADVGTMDVVSADNLYNGTVDKKGVTLYAVLCNLPMHFDTDAPLADLDAFESIHVDLDLAPADGNVDGQTDINLPQE